MGAAIDIDALADCIRETLALHLEAHEGLEHAEVEVAEHVEATGNFGITVDGFPVEIDLRFPGHDAAQPRADWPDTRARIAVLEYLDLPSTKAAGANIQEVQALLIEQHGLDCTVKFIVRLFEGAGYVRRRNLTAPLRFYPRRPEVIDLREPGGQG